MKSMAKAKLAPKLGCTKLSEDLIPELMNFSDREVAQVCQLLKHAKDPELREALLSGESFSPVVGLDKINLESREQDMALSVRRASPPSCIPNFQTDAETKVAMDIMETLYQFQKGTLPS